MAERHSFETPTEVDRYELLLNKSFYMEYLQLTVFVVDTEFREILIAWLAELGFESFHETETELLAFVQKESIEEKSINDFFNDDLNGDIAYRINKISERNWNQVWEQNFEPVVIKNQCLIHAPFHQIKQRYTYELIIEPQMSFGTAHHETTALMLELMLEIDFTDTQALDMGCGTGILGIMASKKGALHIDAIDNNIWAYNNTSHNMKLNHIKNMRVIEGDIRQIPDKSYNTILANINLNVLLDDIPGYVDHLEDRGNLLLSGFFKENIDAIVKLTQAHNLKQVQIIEKNQWVALWFAK